MNMLAGNRRSVSNLARFVAVLALLVIASTVTVLHPSLTVSAQGADTAPTVSDTSQLRTHTVEVGQSFSVTLPAADEGSGNGGPYDYNVWHQGQAASFIDGIDGITFDQHTLVLSGTPQKAGLYKLSYVVHDGDANRDRSDNFRNRDDLRVEVTEPAPEPTPTATPEPTPEPTPTPTPEPEVPPHFPAAVTSYDFTQGQDVGTVTLPEAEGGAGGFTYSLSPALPEGLSFDVASRSLTGTPASVSDSVDYTYTATDAEGAQAELSLMITVTATGEFHTGLPAVTGVQVVTVPSSGLRAKVRITWNAVANPGGASGQMLYRVRLSGGDINGARTETSSSAARDEENLDYNATYRVSVRASFTYNDNAHPPLEGEHSEEVPFTTHRAPVPTGLTVVRERVGSEDAPKLRARWTPVVAATGYQYRIRAVQEGAGWHAPVLTSATDTTLIDASFQGSLYEVQVRALVADLWGPWTESVQARFNHPPAVNDGWINSDHKTLEDFPSSIYPEPGEMDLTGMFSDQEGDEIYYRVNCSPGTTLSVEGEAPISMEVTKSPGSVTLRWVATRDGKAICVLSARDDYGAITKGHAFIPVTILPPQKPDAPVIAVSRTRYEGESAPGLDVTWSAPANANGSTITGYKIEYHAPAQPWQSIPNAWANHTTATIPNLEPGVTYSVRVRATISEPGDGHWSDQADVMTNRPPTGPHTYRYFNNGSTRRGLTVGHWGNWNDVFRDPDGDALIPFVVSSHPARVSIIEVYLPNQGSVFSHRALNQGESQLTYGAYDGYGGKSPEGSLLETTLDSARRTITEQPPSGAPVGEPVTGIPYQGETLSYTLTGVAAAPSGPFVIDSGSGQISVAPGVTLPYEGDWCRPGSGSQAATNVCESMPADKTFTGEVSYTVGGHLSVIEVSIEVVEAVVPDAPEAPAVTRTRFDVETPPALDVTWNVPADNGVAITGYRIEYHAPGQPWQSIVSAGANGATATIRDLQPGVTYSVRVRALTAQSNDGPWSDQTHVVTNSPPHRKEWFLADAHIRVGAWYRDWDTQNRYFGDADGDTLTLFSASSNPAILSTWIGDNGNSTNFVAVNPGRATETYGVTDEYGGRTSRAVVYTGWANVTRRAPESPRGYYVGRPVTGNPTGHGYAISPYSLTGEAAATFDIDPSTGQITLQPGHTLDYETKNSYTGRVEYTINGEAAAIGLTIQVTDLPAPNRPLPPTVTRTEGSDSSLSLGWTAPWSHHAPITDYDLRYRQQGGLNYTWIEHPFEGAGVSTVLTGLTSGANYFVQVRATSAEGTSPWSDDGWLGATPPTTTPDPTPDPDDDPEDNPDPDGDEDPEELPTEGPDGANTAPYFSGPEYRYVDETSVAGTAVGDPVVATDNENDALTYSIIGGGTFTIDSGTGQIRVAEGATLHRATTPSYVVTVRVSDGKDSTGAADTVVDSLVDVTIDVTNEANPSGRLTLILDGPEGPRLTAAPFDVTATFSEEPGQYDVTSGNLRTPLDARQSGAVVTFSGIQPSYDGSIWGTSPYTSRISVGWRGLSEEYEVVVDPEPPRVHRLSGPTETQGGTFTVEIQLTEAVEGFTAEDLDVSNGEVTALWYAGQWLWEAYLSPNANGTLTVDIGANRFQDVSGHGNAAAQQYSVQVDLSPSTPGAPKLLRSSTDPYSVLDVLWAAPQHVDGHPITGYDVQYQEEGAAEWSSHPFTGANPITTLRNLAEGTTYRAQVRARNVHGVSEWSAWGEGSTRMNLPPATDREEEFGRPGLDIICDPIKVGYPGAGGYNPPYKVIAGGTTVSSQQVAEEMIVLDASCVDGDNVSIRGSDRESEFEWTWHQAGGPYFIPYYSLSEGGGRAGSRRSGVMGSAISFDCGNESWRPPHGEYKFVVTVTRNGDFYQKQFVRFTVGDPTSSNPSSGESSQLPPLTADAGPDVAGAAGHSVTLRGTGSTNPYGEWWEMEYLWAQLSGPTVTLSGVTVGNPSFTLPDAAEVGTTLEFQLTVTDEEGETDSDTVTVTVLPTPTAKAGPDLTGELGKSVTLQGKGSTNPYGKWWEMEHLWTQLSGPAVTLSDPTKADPSFTVPSGAADGATLEFQLTVTDREGQSDSDTMTVTVVVIPPTAKAGPDLTGAPGESVTLQGKGSTNPYGKWWQMEHRWTQLSGPAVTLSDLTKADPSFTIPADAADGTTLEFQLTVTDREGNSDSDTVTVTVQSQDGG